MSSLQLRTLPQGPLSLKQNGVFTFVITSRCTDYPLRTQFTFAEEQVTADFVDFCELQLVRAVQLRERARLLLGSDRKRRDLLAIEWLHFSLDS